MKVKTCLCQEVLFFITNIILLYEEQSDLDWLGVFYTYSIYTQSSWIFAYA